MLAYAAFSHVWNSQHLCVEKIASGDSDLEMGHHQVICGRKYDSSPFQRGLRASRGAGHIREAIVTVARRRGVLHGIARHDDSEHGRARHREGARRRPAQHEGCAVELYAEPGGVHSDQWLDGRSLRHTPGVRVGDRPLHFRVVSLRHFERYPRPRRVPHPARLRRRHDVARGPAHHGAGVRKIGTHPRDELRCHTRADWPDARAHRRRSDRWVLSLASHLFRQPADWPARVVSGLSV